MKCEYTEGRWEEGEQERGDGTGKEGEGRWTGEGWEGKRRMYIREKFVRRTRGRDDVVNPVGGVARHRPSGVARRNGENANACVSCCGAAGGREVVGGLVVTPTGARCGCRRAHGHGDAVGQQHKYDRRGIYMHIKESRLTHPWLRIP